MYVYCETKTGVMSRFITSTKNHILDSENYSIVILASIPQERALYSPPISLYPISSHEILLEQQYKVIKEAFPKGQIYIVVGHYAPQVIAKCPKELHIIENQKFNEFGECEELKLAINATITKNIILVSGNILFDSTTLLQMKSPHSSILITEGQSNDQTLVGTISNQAKLENMAFGLNNQWCNISCFTGRELNILTNIVNTKTKSSLCMFEVINSLINRNGIVYTVKLNNSLCRRIYK